MHLLPMLNQLAVLTSAAAALLAALTRLIVILRRLQVIRWGQRHGGRWLDFEPPLGSSARGSAVREVPI